MKKAPFSEQQIAFILRQAEEGTTSRRSAAGKDQRGDLLQLAQGVRRSDAVGDGAVEAARSTLAGLANRRTTPSSRASTENFAPSAGTRTGS
jgi:hypothetical protein